MPVHRYIWWLPRPRKCKYPGGFPLHFEKKLLSLLRIAPGEVCQPFAGMCEYGLRIDVRREVKPDIIADAHHLPVKDNIFQLTLLDPPYSDDYSKELFGTGKVHPSQYNKEAVRITKPGGFVVLYHYYLPERIKDTKWYAIIALITRQYHRARIVSIFRKLKLIISLEQFLPGKKE
uniref:Methyltransferase n=2 Tax=viral metagenome TaxID=1070528 RepID=A0A6H1ZRB6_9ZZZZ